ncbi:MAG: S1C family serine protease [Candidatus Eisenbacteria bacterium]
MRELACILVVVAVAGAAVDGRAQGIDVLERDVVRLVDGVSESIVSVAAISGPHAARSVGCGIVFDEAGLILTTASVVGRALQVEVGTRGGKKIEGMVVGSDAMSDLAIIRVDGLNLKPAKLGESENLLPGSLVFVLGNAFGSLPSVSMGVVSTPPGRVDNEVGESMLRLSVAINPGDIGGPVVNSRGEVIGIVIGRLTFQSRYQAVSIQERGSFKIAGTPQVSSMTVAMPAQRAVAMAGDIMKTGMREPGFLGVQVLDLSRDMKGELGRHDTGVVVTHVVTASPAESIGIVVGDVITMFGARAVESVGFLRDAVRAARPGDITEITFVRGSKTLSDGVRISRMVPEYVREASLGVQGVGPEEVQARIEDLKAEIEILRTQLKNMEKRQ